MVTVKIKEAYMEASTPELLAEKKLFELVRHSFRCTQFCGYTPLSWHKNNSLRHKWFAIPAIYQILLLLSSGVLSIYSATEVDVSVFKKIGILGETEILSGLGLSMCMIVLIIFHKVLGIFDTNKVLTFWENNYRLLARFAANEIDLHSTHQDKLGAIPKSNKRTIQTYVLLILGGLALAAAAVVSGNKFVNSALELLSLHFLIGQIITGLQFYSHFCQTLWIATFIKLYAALSSILATELKFLRLNKPKNELGEGSFNSRITALIRLYKNLEAVVVEYNATFGTRIVAEVMFWCFVVLLYTFFGILWLSRGEIFFSLTSIPLIIIFLSSYYHLGSDSSKLSCDTRAVGEQLSELYELAEVDVTNLRKIQMLAMKLNTTPPKISGAMFFNVDRQLLSSTFCALATYLFILLQFQLNEVTHSQSTGSIGCNCSGIKR